jgi:hypothetical protein
MATIEDKTLARLERQAAEGRWFRKELVLPGEREGFEHIKGGRLKQGLLAIGGANAGMFQSLLVGAGLMFVATTDYFTKTEFFVKHWWIRGVAALVIGLILLRQGTSTAKTWASALLTAAAAVFIKDWRSRPGAEESSGPSDQDAGYWWEGRWVEPRWERERERELGRRPWELPEGTRAAERMAERVFEGARREF